MLAAECVRLAALEVLCPKTALDADANYPTLARDKVFDCRTVGLDDLDRGAKFTPCLSLYTDGSETAARGDASGVDDMMATSTLEIVAELAIATTDDDGEPFADAMPGGDWDARLALAALCAQVRRTLTYDERGFLFRRFVTHINQVSEELFAFPELGARFQRMTMRFMVHHPDDSFDDASGLPVPIATLQALLPDGTAAKARLAALAAQFASVDRTALSSIHAETPDGETGFNASTE